jgi:transcriptional regulator with XRE-family HTH domain
MQIYTVLTTAQLYELLEARRIELGLSHMELGEAAFGRADNSAIMNIKRGSSPTIERLIAICGALGLEVFVGKPRSLAGLSEDPGPTDFAPPSQAPSGFLTIPWNQPAIGAGSAPLAIQAAWLDAQGLIPERLSAVLPDQALLENVEPGRTVAIIDSPAARRGAGSIWCLEEKGQKTLARVAWLDDCFVIMPAFAHQAPRLISGEERSQIGIIGRVAILISIPTSGSETIAKQKK